MSVSEVVELPVLVTKRRAAEVLGLTTRSVDRLIEAGRLAKVKLNGHCTRITTESIRDFIQESAVAA